MTAQWRMRVLAIVIAGALVGCGGSSGGGAGSEPVPATSPVEVTADAWRAQADALCTEYKAKLDALPEPNAATEVVSFLRQGVSLTNERNAKFAELTAPPELVDAQATMVRLLGDTNAKIEQAIAKIEGGTAAEAAFNEFNAAIEKNGVEVDAAAQQAGLAVCGGD